MLLAALLVEPREVLVHRAQSFLHRSESAQHLAVAALGLDALLGLPARALHQLGVLAPCGVELALQPVARGVGRGQPGRDVADVGARAHPQPAQGKAHGQADRAGRSRDPCRQSGNDHRQHRGDVRHESRIHPVRHHGAVENNALVAALVGAALALVPPVWRYTRHVVTLVHEAGHAMVALLTGRRLNAVRLHSDTSGHTISSGRPRGPGMVAMAAAGYLAPSALGLACIWLVDAGHTPWALWAALAHARADAPVRPQLVRPARGRAGRRCRRGADLAHAGRRPGLRRLRARVVPARRRHPARRSTCGATADACAAAPPTPTCWPASPTSPPACGTRSCCSRRSRRWSSRSRCSASLMVGWSRVHRRTSPGRCGRPHRRPLHPARRHPHPGVHPGRHQGDRQGGAARGDARARRPGAARQRLPPVPAAGRRHRRGGGRSRPLHELARPDVHRLRRVPGAEPRRRLQEDARDGRHRASRPTTSSRRARTGWPSSTTTA